MNRLIFNLGNNGAIKTFYKDTIFAATVHHIMCYTHNIMCVRVAICVNFGLGFSNNQNATKAPTFLLCRGI